MASIVIELQRLASDGQTSVVELLRKALIVATKLQINDFRKWVEKEMSGYSILGRRDVRQLPLHREICGTPHRVKKGQLVAIVASNYQGQMIRESIAEIQEIVSGGTGVIVINAATPYDIMNVVPQGVNIQFQECPFVWVIQRTQLIGILNQVRDIVLKWSLKLEEQGIVIV